MANITLITVMYGILAHLKPPLITSLQRGGLPTFATTFNHDSFIDIIHSTENKAIKEGTTLVNSNYKSSHMASNFMVIYIMLIRRICMKS